MPSFHLRVVLVATLIVCCFSQLPANASQKRVKALVAEITQDPTSLLYTFEIQQRTPLQIQRLVLDIEQDYMWVRCDKKSYRSSTYSPLACTAQLCKSYEYSSCGTCYGSRAPGCNNDTCVVPGQGRDRFELAQDITVLPSSDGSNPGPLATFPNLLFACAAKEDLSNLPRGTAGVAGMSSSTLAMPAQFSAEAGFGRKFAICLSGITPGIIYFGDEPIVFLPPPGTDLSRQLTRTPLIKNPVYSSAFYIGVERIEVGGVRLPIDSEKLLIDERGRGGTKLSTVARYTQLATPIYDSLVGVFTSLLRQRNISRVASAAPFGACFDSSVDVTNSLGPNGYQISGFGVTRVGPSVPAINLVMQGNDSTVWSTVGINSMVDVSDNVLCLGFLDAGEDPVASIVIGTFQMEDNLLQFDLATGTFGFSNSLDGAQTTCADFNFTTSS